jgi:ATP-dependent Clp protease ATP-binding subunit ClpC
MPLPRAARLVVVLGQEEARNQLRHDYVGSERLLMGLLRESEGLAARLLDGLGDTIEDAPAEG